MRAHVTVLPTRFPTAVPVIPGVMGDMSFQRLYVCDRCDRIVRRQWNTSPSERWLCLRPGIERRGNGLEVEVSCEGSVGFCKDATANFGSGLRSVSSADAHLLQTTCSNKCGRQVVGMPIVGQDCDDCNGFMIATRYASAAKKRSRQEASKQN